MTVEYSKYLVILSREALLSLGGREPAANSQAPAALRMWPIPGVANSTTKWPHFSARERAIPLSPAKPMPPASPARVLAGPPHR